MQGLWVAKRSDSSCGAGELPQRQQKILCESWGGGGGDLYVYITAATSPHPLILAGRRSVDLWMATCWRSTERDNNNENALSRILHDTEQVPQTQSFV